MHTHVTSICIYIYIYIYICIYVFICVYIYTCNNIDAIYIYIYICIACTYICIYIYICICQRAVIGTGRQVPEVDLVQRPRLTLPRLLVDASVAEHRGALQHLVDLPRRGQGDLVGGALRPDLGGASAAREAGPAPRGPGGGRGAGGLRERGWRRALARGAAAVRGAEPPHDLRRRRVRAGLGSARQLHQQGLQPCPQLLVGHPCERRRRPGRGPRAAATRGPRAAAAGCRRRPGEPGHRPGGRSWPGARASIKLFNQVVKT